MSAALKSVVEHSQNIIELIVANGAFTKLVSAAKAAGLTDTLKGAGPFTLFAPSDEAFKKLPEGTLANLLKPENKAELTRILTYHVVSGNVPSSALTGKKFSKKSVEGAELRFDGMDGLTVNGVKIVTPDSNASNGVIHVIDTVMMPPKA